jgi:hypothetical protein
MNNLRHSKRFLCNISIFQSCADWSPFGGGYRKSIDFDRGSVVDNAKWWNPNKQFRENDIRVLFVDGVSGISFFIFASLLSQTLPSYPVDPGIKTSSLPVQ